MNRFARTEQLLGKAGLERILEARVAVFGLGAVGSFAVEALARAGVGWLRLVDFDTINETNINRQIYALHSTVGTRKTAAAENRVRDINPECRIDVRDVFVNEESLGDLLSDRPDVVVDAVDGLNSKVNLLCRAREEGLAVVSSMGAAGRRDLSMIRTGDISQTSVCPLARFVRQRLRRRGVDQGIRCVYSVEKPLNKQPYHEADAEEAEHGRTRPPIGSLPHVPAAFGLYAAGMVLDLILDEAGEVTGTPVRPAGP